MQVSVIGLGYIGLPTAAMLASHGIRVLGIDTNEDVCRVINNGEIHFSEPFLGEIVETQVSSGMIICNKEVQPSSAFLIAVPTPMTAKKKADLSHVIEAASAIAEVLEQGNLVVLESTVPPRCTNDILKPILERSGLLAGEDFYLAYCPERVLPGQIIYELKHNDRVIGGINKKSAEKAAKLYSTFVKGEMYLTDTITAELCKLMENTYRDVNIALANELAKISENLGTNAWEVIKYANKHPRVHIHLPGPGVGGHCLAVDPWFVLESSRDIAPIVELARHTNDSMPMYIANKIAKLVPINSKILVLGVTYKPDVDDMRESPILSLIDLLKQNYELSIVDPLVDTYNVDVYDAAKDADLVVLAVHHQRFKQVDLKMLAKMVKKPVLLDTRNFFERSLVEYAGFEYHLFGETGHSQVETVAKGEVASAEE